MSGSLAPHVHEAAEAIAAFSLLDAVGDVWVSTVPTVAYDPATLGTRLMYETATRTACADGGFEPAPFRHATREDATRAHANAVALLRAVHRDIPLRYIVPVQPVTRQEVA